MRRVIAVVSALLSFCVGAQTLTLAAASSYRPILDAVAEDFSEQMDITVRTIYGSSGKLASQIRAGAPFDVYFSANPVFIQHLQQQGYVEHVVTDGVGQLALWAATKHDERLTPASLIAAERIAIAQPRHAPYGKAAMQWLTTQTSEDLRDKLVFAENVAQAAQLVFSGAANYGLVALSVIPLDARDERQLVVLAVDNEALLEQRHGIVTASKNYRLAQQFSQYFQSPRFNELKQRYGLKTISEDNNL